MEAKRSESIAVAFIKENPKYFYRYASSKSKNKASIEPLVVEGQYEQN